MFRGPTLALAALALALLPLSACVQVEEFPGYKVIDLEQELDTVLPAGWGPEDLEFLVRQKLARLQPGTVLEFPAGNWPFTDELVITQSHITVRGQGPQATTLDFTTQITGGQGIVATGDAFVIQNLRVLNPRGDGVRIEGVDGARVQNVHVVWSGEPRKENGAYGLYPVLSKNVLIEGCYVRGASDAGIYVGQSEGVVLRWSRAEANVAGIEIENTKDADVYLNVSTDNTGGLLVFDGVGLQREGCRADVDEDNQPDCKGTRVYANFVHDNNRPNFASGGTVALVPKGTGFLLLSTDKIEVFGNVFVDNDNANAVIVSYALLKRFGFSEYPATFDPYPEHIDIHHNVLERSGSAPDTDNPLALIASQFFADVAPNGPEIVYDGFVDPAKAGADGNLRPEVQICIHDNQTDVGPVYGNLAEIFFPNRNYDVSDRACSLVPRDPTELAALPPAPEVEPPPSDEEVAALCNTGAPVTQGVNWAAAAVDCPNLADYRLFQDPTEATRNPSSPGLLYDLTTPLFSDYAQKYRFVFLPPGTQAIYDADAAFDFPVGTIIAKTFSFAYDLRDLALGEEVVETRLLVRRPSGWVGLVYLWDAAKTQALLRLEGASHEVSWIDAAGEPVTTTYQIPNSGQCLRCHTSPTNGAEPIGPKARWLNRNLDYGDAVENQLVRWTGLGLLAGAPADPAAAPRLPVWNDPSDGTLEERARTYLEANCVYCHRPGGAAGQSGMYLSATRPLSQTYGICKTPVSPGPGAGGLDYDIVPGDPLSSILVFRMARNEPEIKMPEISRSLVHTEGLALVSQWISSLDGSCP